MKNQKLQRDLFCRWKPQEMCSSCSCYSGFSWQGNPSHKIFREEKHFLTSWDVSLEVFPSEFFFGISKGMATSWKKIANSIRKTHLWSSATRLFHEIFTRKLSVRFVLPKKRLLGFDSPRMRKALRATVRTTKTKIKQIKHHVTHPTMMQSRAVDRGETMEDS